MEKAERLFTDKKEFWRKIAVIIAGAIISAYGITLALGAGYGSATLAVLWQGVAGTFHITIGLASFIIAALMILGVLIFDKKQIHIGTILYQIFYSGFVELFGRLHRYPDNRIICAAIMVAGIVLFAIGTGMYASAKLGRGSYEAVTFAIVEKNNWPIKYVRISLDMLVVLVGFLLGGKVGVCTICTIFLSGPIIQLANKQSTRIFKWEN